MLLPAGLAGTNSTLTSVKQKFNKYCSFDYLKPELGTNIMTNISVLSDLILNSFLLQWADPPTISAIPSFHQFIYKPRISVISKNKT